MSEIREKNGAAEEKEKHFNSYFEASSKQRLPT